jgi:hypothetical protein
VKLLFQKVLNEFTFNIIISSQTNEFDGTMSNDMNYTQMMKDLLKTGSKTLIEKAQARSVLFSFFVLL